MSSTSTAKFLGINEFEGQAIPSPGPVIVGGEATFNGFITVTNVESDLITPLLLDGYELAPLKPESASKYHPVMLLFGDQTDGAFVVGESLQPSGVHYSEMIFVIPFVQKLNETDWHTFILRMYLDNDWAVAAGAIYGYRKRKAIITWPGDEVKIQNILGQDLLEGDFQWGTTWHNGNDALSTIPNFGDMVTIMTTRLLGQNIFGPVCSHFEWDLTKAKVAEAKTTYTMKAPFRSRMTAWPNLSPFENVMEGAVVIRGLKWRLANNTVPC